MEINVRVLVVGLGSMGKRRVRNLQALGGIEVAGFDVRDDRLAEASGKYNIKVFHTFEAALNDFKPEALVISTSPKHHMTYAWAGFEKKLPCFIEASVVDADRILELSKRVTNTNLVMAPSCTMRFFPGPKKVKEIILSNLIGKPLNINYQTGQYLPDWHPWEPIQDFYVSDRETGGGREIVPFELTWLNDIFGEPEALACVKSKVTDMAAEIDDIYHCLLRYPGNILANMTVEVVSRPFATRELRVLGSEGELVMSADENCVRYARAGGQGGSPEWVRFPMGGGTVETGYINPEEPYIAELGSFIEAAKSRNQTLFPNNLEDDWRVLHTLSLLEEISEPKA